ncbi:MAG: TRAP transporter small permease [Rhodospirillales bacterium]|nr:TRAP transporter small permease [Rhodospirillales bacterium]
MTSAATPNLFTRSSHWLDRALGAVAAVIMFAMMAVTFVDVLGRYVFNQPLPGAFESIQIMMGTLIFSALPLVSAKEEHVTVDIIHSFLSPRRRRILDILVNAIGAGVMALLAWRVWLKAGQVVSYGDATPILKIPMGWVVYFMALMTVVSVVILFANMIRHIRRRPGRHPAAAND